MHSSTLAGLFVGLLLVFTGAYGVAAPVSDRAHPGGTALWTLVVQLPRDGTVRVERSGGVLRGRPAAVLARLRRGTGGFLALRRIVAGTVSIESPRVSRLQEAGSVLVVSVAVPAKRRVRVVSTNRMPLSEEPGHLTVLNLQLVSEGELFARSPFAVVDDSGRTAVLFQ